MDPMLYDFIMFERLWRYLCHVLELVMLFCGIELLCLLSVKLFS